MIDFATLQGVTIPEGVVAQIADASGSVLWSALRTAKVTITSVCNGINGDTAHIKIVSDTEIFEAYAYDMPNCTIEVPVGSTIACAVRDTKTAERRCYVVLNGTKVLEMAGTYTYTVTGDVSVHVADQYAMGEYGMITITE